MGLKLGGVRIASSGVAAAMDSFAEAPSGDKRHVDDQSILIQL